MMIAFDIAFADITADDLATMSETADDDPPFGVIGIDREGVARVYNAAESRLVGLPPGVVIGP